MKPVPFGQLTQRMATAGRIRAGYKDEKGKLKKAENWILSAQVPDDLEVLAGIYGGQVEPWSDEKSADKFRVFTETRRLEVVLPPNPLSEPTYRKWDAGGLRRLCDAVTCTGFPKDGSPPQDVPCICQTVDDPAKHCKPDMVLGVMFPQCPIGQWTLKTTSMNAVRELQTSVEVVRMATAARMPRAILTRQSRKSGKNHFEVPVLQTLMSFDQLESAAVEAGLPGLTGPASVAELGAGTPVALGTPMEAPRGAVLEPIDDEFGGEVDEMGPIEVASAPIEVASTPVERPEVVEPEPEPEPEPDPLDEAAELMETMRNTQPHGGPRKELPTDMAPEGTREIIVDAFLLLDARLALKVKKALDAEKLWPLSKIPDDRLAEAANVMDQALEGED